VGHLTEPMIAYQPPRCWTGKRKPLRMKIGHSITNTVAFLCQEDDISPGVGRVVPKATAFLVLVVEDDGKHPYVVTARHCIEETRREGFFVRVNTIDGVVDVPTHADNWFLHDDADVAVTPFVAETRHSLNAFGLEWLVLADYTVDPGLRLRLTEAGLSRP
jgi:hypothetical protein